MYSITIDLMDERETCEPELPAELLKTVITGAYASRAKMNASVNIMVVDDSRISELNELYLNHEGPTDVLAFSDGDIENGILLLGDIAVSADTAARVAPEKAMNFEEELTLYALHGFLHLLGMDDHSDSERAEMIAAQAEEFSRHGLNFNQ